MEKVEENLELSVMPTIPEDAVLEAPKKKEKATKEKKPRKPMSAEHKEKVLKALVKAREASNLARAKRTEVKKIKKRDADADLDEIIRKDILKKTAKSDDKDKKIQELEKKLAGLTLQDIVKKPKPKPKVLEEEEDESDYTSTPEVEPNYVSKPFKPSPSLPDRKKERPKTPTPPPIKEPEHIVSHAQHIQQAPSIPTNKVYRGRVRRKF